MRRLLVSALLVLGACDGGDGAQTTGQLSEFTSSRACVATTGGEPNCFDVTDGTEIGEGVAEGRYVTIRWKAPQEATAIEVAQ